ncbi:unnamed protein product [Prunus brigantina]
MGALQRVIREMMEPEAIRGERPTYKKPYPAYIDQILLSPGFKVPNFTLFNREDTHASSVEHIGRLSVQCIAIENNPLLKLRLFGNSLSGQAFTWYTSLPANSVQTWEQMENFFHNYYFRIQPEVTISDLATLKQCKDEPAQDFMTRFRKLKMKCRIPMEERHFIQMAQTALKISLRKRFDGMMSGDLVELADKASKYEELLREEQQKRNSSKGTYYKAPSSSVHLDEVESEEGTEGSEEREVAVVEMAKLNHPISCKALTKPPPFTRGFVPNKPAHNKVYSFDLTKGDALFDEMLLQKAIDTPQRCKCESELEVTQDGQSQPTPSVFDRIGTSDQDGLVPTPPRDRARHKDYLRPATTTKSEKDDQKKMTCAQCNKRITEQPKKEIPIKMPGNDKPLATIIEGRWYSVGKSGRPTLELTRTQKRRVQRQYYTFLKNKDDTQVLPETSSIRKGKNPEVAHQAEQTTCQPEELTKNRGSEQTFNSSCLIISQSARTFTVTRSIRTYSSRRTRRLE